MTIRLPHVLLQPILIKNETRHVLFPPLIFVLCIEPLAAAIRLNPDITGVTLRDREFKVSLYADDVLLTLTNLRLTLPNLLSQLRLFGSLSGYKVNTSKTEALPVNVRPPELAWLQSYFTYQWKTSSLRYLRTQLTPSFTSLYGCNYPKLFLEIHPHQMECFTALPFWSYLGSQNDYSTEITTPL